MSTDELMTQVAHDHQDKDPVMESHTEKEITSMLNCFQKVQEEKEEGGCDEQVNCNSLDEPDEPMDSDPLDKGDEPMDSDSLEKDHCPSPTKSEDGPREMQGTAETICSAPVDATSVLNDSTSTENSEDPNHNTSEMETQRAVEQPEPVTEKMAPSEDVLDETSKSMSPGHVPELDQKPLTASECNSEASEADALTENPTDLELSSRGRPRKEKRVIKCEYCGRPFNHASAYIIHRRVHTGEKPFSCQICSRAFAQLSNLRSHMKVHNSPKFLSMQQYNSLEKKTPVVKTVPQKEERVRPEPREESPNKSRSPSRRSRKPVACPICGKIFPYKSVLKIHLRIHSGEKPYTCRVCGKAFTQACTVRVHERVHWSIKPFLCSKCGKGFSQIGTLKAHTCAGKPQVHSTLKEMELAGVVTFRCHLCRECFSTRDEYDPHLQTHTDNQRYSCERCGQKYGLRSELDTHSKYCFSMWLAKTKPFNRLASAKLHTKQAPTDKTVQSSPVENAPDSPVKSPMSPISPTLPILSPPKESSTPPRHVYSSPLPQKRKKYLSLLTCPPKVIATSIYDPENNVGYCQPFKTSYFVSQLNSLDQKADPRKYLCPRCGRLFRHVGRLRAHMLTHSRGKSFTCGECGRISEDWSTFWRHQRVHKQRRGRFFCPICGQGFRFASSYMEHLQEHPELNEYFCPFCPQTFADAESLKNHQEEWHRSSMPHICDICGKGFQSPVVLKRHRVGHCFQDRETDTPHIVDVQPTVKPYECGKCSASFKTLDRLFSHQLCHSTKRDSNLSLSNGIINGHKELKEEKQQNSAQKDHKSNQHVRASTSESNTSDSCQDTANGSSPSSLPMVPNGSDEAKAQPQQDIDTSVSQSTATLPLSSSDSESIPPEVEEEVKTPTFTYERTKEIKKNAEPDQTIGDATPRSKPERKTGHLECTECGAWFALLPALHRHYLEHAWGQF
ncbi:zinc finger protein 184 [Astyanax mexicanus]|uniref:zinc finger protein 184 n=1 Tax=Astyanax mexicanus TaxID=7994 RepID=UPI0020CB5615|nr:zinc finger protein 184 [Astyanax mexicanus]XP_049336130.1 zinc finger protein 184 [Astyanax mexicanus]